MKEFFVNIANWFIIHKDELVVTLTTLATSGVLANIIAFIRQHKAIKQNTDAANALANTSEKVEAIGQAVIELHKDHEILTAKVNETVSTMDILLTKVNAMLDVQSLVYATIKDEKTRVAVNNILTNAKYAVTEQRAKLLEQLAALREQIAQKAKDDVAKVNEAVEKAVSIVEATDKENNVVTRG